MSDRSVNEIRIEGRLAFDVESRPTSAGGVFSKSKLAVSDIKKGEKVTYWFSVVAFKDAADVFVQHRKGDRLIVTGKLTIDEWTGKDGQKRTTPTILVFDPTGIEAPDRASEPKSEPHTDADRPGPGEEDIPF